MKNILVLNSSLNGENGNSNKLTNTFVEKAQESLAVKVSSVDLNAAELSHLSIEEMTSWQTTPEERTQRQQTLAAVSDNYIEQLMSADVLVLGMPMYNFGIPSVFKAWIDRVARAGITFKYTPTGPVGLLDNKKVIVLAARGGMYAGTPKDTQTQYLKDVFGFIGLDDVEFVYAEGLAMGEQSYNDAFLQANEKIIELIGNL
ncbi:MAG: FMN-dependent NADH-azoreductase [Alteromonadaceae bacterium]|nr:FMN-dependent NADH-azoreductase [Alteromonadaceae bacterium]